MRICKNCNKVYQDVASFCPICGHLTETYITPQSGDFNFPSRAPAPTNSDVPLYVRILLMLSALILTPVAIIVGIVFAGNPSTSYRIFGQDLIIAGIGSALFGCLVYFFFYVIVAVIS